MGFFLSKRKAREELEGAVKSGDIENVGEILSKGLNPNYYLWFKGDGQPLLLSAIIGFFETPIGYREKVPIEIIKLLLDGGADPNIGDTHNDYTPLMFAARKGDISVLELLLKAGADLNKKSKIGLNALACAKEGSAEIVELLKRYGAK